MIRFAIVGLALGALLTVPVQAQPKGGYQGNNQGETCQQKCSRLYPPNGGQRLQYTACMRTCK